MPDATNNYSNIMHIILKKKVHSRDLACFSQNWWVNRLLINETLTRHASRFITGWTLIQGNQVTN